MANWDILKSAIAGIIKTNGRQEITGQLLQNVLNNIVTSVGENATFAGIATPTTNPGAPDGPVFYLATRAGEYANFNGITILEGEAAILQWNNGAWTKKISGFSTEERLLSFSSKVNVVHTKKTKDKYIDASGTVHTDQNFDLFEFDINGATKLSMFYATGGGQAVFKNGLGAVTGVPMQTEGHNTYESKWIDVDIPADAEKLFVTQAKNISTARPLCVLMDRYQEPFLKEAYEEVDNTPFLMSPANTITYAENGLGVDITFNTTSYNFIDEFNNTLNIPIESGTTITVAQFHRLYLNRDTKAIELDNSGAVYNNKVTLLAYVERGKIINGLLANHFKDFQDNIALGKNRIDNYTLNSSLLRKPIAGSLYDIEPTSVEDGILYYTDGTTTELTGYSTKRYTLSPGTNIRVFIKTYYNSSNFIHIAYINDRDEFVPLINSVTPAESSYYLSISKNIKELLVSGCSLQGINNNAATRNEITSDEPGYYGLNEEFPSFVTVCQAWFYEKELLYEGFIESIDLPTANIENTVVHVLIGEKTDDDTITVTRVRKCFLTTGTNVLDEPILFNKGNYIGFVTQDKAVSYRQSGTDLAHCFASREQSLTSPTIGLKALRNSKITAIKYGIGYNLTYHKELKDSVHELSQEVESLRQGLSYDKYKEKKFLFIGDSITDTGYYINSIVTKTGCIAYNRGVSGTTLAVNSSVANSMCERLDLDVNDIPTAKYQGFPSEADYVFVLGGINDWGRLRNQVFGDLNAAIDNTTFCGALKYLYKGLKSRYPGAKIVILNLLHTYSPTQYVNWKELSYEDDDETKAITVALNNVGKSLYDYRDAISKAAQMYGLPVIDLFNVGFTATLDKDRAAYYVDGLHPNEAGGEIMADYILKQLSIL